MGAGGGRRLSIAVVAGLALFAVACSGGGDGGDPTSDRGFEGAPGERLLQFTGAGIRTLVADLEANGSFPPRDQMRPEHQTLLPIGQDALYKAMFAADPLADAGAVNAPVMIAMGEKSTSVSQEDAALLAQAVGGTSDIVVAPNATATLQTLKAPPRLVAGGDLSDMSMMGGGPIIADAPREEATVTRIASFLGASLGARPA